MRRIIKLLGAIVFGNLLSFYIFRYLNRKQIIILGYHNVTNMGEEPDIKNPLIVIDITRFEEQMRFLKRYYNLVDEKEIILALDGKKSLPPYAVWITFDDGLRNNYTNAYPTLRKYKIPATFFIVVSLVRNNDNSSRYMSWEEIKEMLQGGLSFGAHTVHHKILSQLSSQELADEIVVSKNKMEEELKIKVVSFAYPYGQRSHFDLGKCRPILMNSGFKVAVTTVRGKNGFGSLNKDPYDLKRLTICSDDILIIFRAKICSGGFGQKT